MSTATVAAETTALRKSRAWNLVLIGFPLLVAAGLFALREMQVHRLSSGDFPRYGSVPAFQLINQDGHSFGSVDLAGKIWIADFIYSTCPGPCPMISSRMSEMQRPLEKTDVHFVSFTVDPDKDTPEILREYANRLRAQPGRWDFLTGPKSVIYDLSTRGFKLPAAEHDGDNGQPVHSTRIVLVDRQGQIRAYEEGSAPDSVTKLLAETNRLLREQPATAARNR